jgi:protease-4
MASGGYYVAVAADGIMAGPTATVGSIGVIINHLEASDAIRKLGIKADPIVSGEHKDMGSPLREMTPEERRLLQEYVDASHRRFVEVVARGRKLLPEQVAKLANGDIFTAEDALKHGLVDRVGYVEDALDWIGELSGHPRLRVIAYRRPFSLERMFREVGRETARSFWENSPLRARPAVE